MGAHRQWAFNTNRPPLSNQGVKLQKHKEERTFYRINAPISPRFRQPRKQDLIQLCDHMHTRIHWLPSTRRTLRAIACKDQAT